MTTYIATFRWNDHVTLHGTCTATVARDLLHELVCAQFAGKTYMTALGRIPTLDVLLKAQAGMRFSDVISDETGVAKFQLECI